MTTLWFVRFFCRPFGQGNQCWGWKRIITLDNPIYSFIGEFNKRELNRFLESYSREKRDIVYASISTSAFAVGDSGDDLYLNIFFS